METPPLLCRWAVQICNRVNITRRRAADALGRHATDKANTSHTGRPSASRIASNGDELSHRDKSGQWVPTDQCQFTSCDAVGGHRSWAQALARSSLLARPLLLESAGERASYCVSSAHEAREVLPSRAHSLIVSRLQLKDTPPCITQETPVCVCVCMCVCVCVCVPSKGTLLWCLQCVTLSRPFIT